MSHGFKLCLVLLLSIRGLFIAAQPLSPTLETIVGRIRDRRTTGLHVVPYSLVVSLPSIDHLNPSNMIKRPQVCLAHCGKYQYYGTQYSIEVRLVEYMREELE